ncbi:MAG: hypothetical protein ACO1QS_16815 [Verrucomicrobiota bacterium]
MNRAKYPGLLTLSLLALALWLLPASAQAVVLNWDAVNWTSGSLSQSFDIDSNNAGNDITITITGDTDEFVVGPVDNTNLTGGLSPAQEGLFLNMNYSDVSESIRITVTFHYAYGVEDVSFSIFDIDEGADSYRDRIDLLGKSMSNGLVAPTTITGSPDNQVRNSGTTNVYVRGNDSTSDTSGDANADYTFSGTNVIKEFTFVYGNHSTAPDNPGNQWITLHDITYTPKIPEWHPGLIASFACMMLVGVRRFFF